MGRKNYKGISHVAGNGSWKRLVQVGITQVGARVTRTLLLMITKIYNVDVYWKLREQTIQFTILILICDEKLIKEMTLEVRSRNTLTDIKLILVRHFKMEILIWIMGQLNLDHGIS